MDEEEVIRQRLLTRSSVLGSKHGIKRTAEALFNYLEATGSLGVYYNQFASNPPAKKRQFDTKTAKETLETFLWELELVEADAVKCELLMHTCSQELKAYASLHADIDKQILSVTTDIDRLKEVVANEKQIRSYKEEYEAKAREVNVLPSKQDSLTAVEALEDQLRQSKEALATATERIEQRSKEFALLMRAIRDLQCLHKEDTVADEALEDEEIDNDKDDEEYDKDSKRSRHAADTEGTATPPPSQTMAEDEDAKTN
ncbi:hypothetical protein THRCLA_23242 [Thraustotheca clavata]|uniref:THO complex subunit 7 n=1 Tax=Thraustotheca clavata TaxID=74557 RepID=A0A1V9Y8P3_9STRA|nr:hypothetical protein THRCLA_23242 [Thraustotheca clavata]